ncbi:hypothetical protein DFH07DRAFT_765697 [Mycena maculata]|uniref:Uncharacterized protein n=1 Tax=Mycena maculata TaxID=230809 RepID=A0AAD7NXS7_9AGAR|nr:hypothetical protein DFH07DRAFT_765697 [Mycena maculata]
MCSTHPHRTSNLNVAVWRLVFRPTKTPSHSIERVNQAKRARMMISLSLLKRRGPLFSRNFEWIDLESVWHRYLEMPVRLVDLQGQKSMTLAREQDADGIGRGSTARSDLDDIQALYQWLCPLNLQDSGAVDRYMTDMQSRRSDAVKTTTSGTSTYAPLDHPSPQRKPPFRSFPFNFTARQGTANRRRQFAPQVWTAEIVGSPRTLVDLIIIQESMCPVPSDGGGPRDFIYPKDLAGSEVWGHERFKDMPGLRIPYFFGLDTIQIPSNESLVLEYIPGRTLTRFSGPSRSPSLTSRIFLDFGLEAVRDIARAKDSCGIVAARTSSSPTHPPSAPPLTVQATERAKHYLMSQSSSKTEQMLHIGTENVYKIRDILSTANLPLRYVRIWFVLELRRVLGDPHVEIKKVKQPDTLPMQRVYPFLHTSCIGRGLNAATIRARTNLIRLAYGCSEQSR